MEKVITHGTGATLGGRVATEVLKFLKKEKNVFYQDGQTLLLSFLPEVALKATIWPKRFKFEVTEQQKFIIFTYLQELFSNSFRQMAREIKVPHNKKEKNDNSKLSWTLDFTPGKKRKIVNKAPFPHIIKILHIHIFFQSGKQEDTKVPSRLAMS